jgi:hypothetical protein
MPTLQNGRLSLERCPHCSVDLPSLNKTGQGDTSDHVGGNRRYWFLLQCTRCGGMILALSRDDHGGGGIDLYPKVAEVANEIPTRARECLTQTISSISAPMGGVILAASAVDATLQAKGYTDGVLYSRIDKAAADHLITEGMAKWAHQVRLDANGQRHVKDDAPLPTPHDAKLAIDFALALGEFLFVLPSRVGAGISASMPKKAKA